MHLDKLEIKGFKSFRDKTVLEFPDQFTAIVGPNGSGKSNVIDSICFVLGRSRGLRVNNISELICNGGPGAKECDSAKVSMHLSNGSGKHVKVSREIDRAGKSVYRVDDKVSSRQEIIDIMGDNEYNIILQSDVNKVIDMKPKDRRKIIDDLCGIGEYDAKKEKAIAELEKVEAKIAEINIITGEKQGYLTELEKEKDEAVRFQTFQTDLRKAKATILSIEVQDHEKKQARLQEKIEKLRSERESNTTRILSIKTEIAEKNRQLREANARILKLEEERGGTKLLEIKGEITRNQDKIEGLNSSLQNLKAGLSEKKKRKHALAEEEKKLESDLKNITKELTPLAEELRKESEKAAMAGADAELDRIKTEVYDTRSKITSTEMIISRDESAQKSLEEEKEGLEEKVKELLKCEKDLARSIDDHMIKNKSGFQEYENLKAEIPVLNRRYSEITKELEEVQIKFAEKNSEQKTLERTSDNYSSSVSAVMNLKSIIPGIYGVASQLGSISRPEYTKALQVAGGNRLQSIVVENEDVAAKCIDYLRKKRVGRATFLPLNKMKVNVDDRLPKGALGFARNFITAPFKFEKIFAYVYGDTVLIKDLDAAKKVGIGDWRMVTLDGDLVTKEGAMTGGYMKEVSIKFSSTEELEAEIKALEKKTIALDGERQEVELKKKKAEDKIARMEESVSGGKTDVEKVRLEKESLTLRRSELSQGAEGLEAKIEDLRKRISAGKESAESLKQDLESAKKKLEKAEKKAPKTDTAALDALREKERGLDIEKNRLEEKSSLLAAQTKEIEAEAEKLEKEIGEAEQNIKKLQEISSDLSHKLKAQEKDNLRLIEDIEKLISERSKIEEEMTSMSSESGSMEFSNGKISEDLSRQEIEKAKVETRYNDLRREFEAYAGVELVADVKLKELEGLVADLEEKLSKFGQVNMRAIESYETLKKEIEEINQKLETLKTERQSIFDFMETVEQKKRETFMGAFEVIKKNFEKIYSDLSEGEGTLLLDNPREISDCGLMITASPKGKKLLNIDLMSGGEKVLTTSAFLLAIQRYKPSHFYIVDELDAALDKENSIRLAEMLSKTPAQFMLITHNDSLIKFAQSVIGVSMTAGLSQVVGVKLT